MVDDVVVSVETEVEKGHDLIERINAITEIKEISDDIAGDIARASKALNEQSDALEKVNEEYKYLCR